MEQYWIRNALEALLVVVGADKTCLGATKVVEYLRVFVSLKLSQESGNWFEIQLCPFDLLYLHI